METSFSRNALVNGRIRTMDSDNSLAQAVLVAGGRIERVGSTRDILTLAGRDAQITDLEGKALFPGFIDTHSHLTMYSAWSEHVYCGAEGSLREVLSRLSGRAENLPPGDLVLGWGFDDSILPESRGPTRLELDAVSASHPVLLIHISIHVCYANSAALRQAGLYAGSVIQGGEIVTDENGDAQGTLLETAAFTAISALSPGLTPENFRRALIKGMADYNAQGITSTHEGGIGLGGIDPVLCMDVLRGMERDNALTLRLRLAFLSEFLDRFMSAPSEMITVSGPKFLLDGSIQAYTAALSQPYYDRPDCRPARLFIEEEFVEELIHRHRQGCQITCHGNGDDAIETIISAIEKAQIVYPRKDPRHILVHCQTARDSQLERMKAAGIMPTFFGLHVWYYGDRHYERFLGPERAARLDPSGSAVRLGLHHSLHADSPVLPPWTLRSIHTAVHRITQKGRLLGADQRISVEEAVRAYTSHAAYFHCAEHERGSIVPGKLADFVLLSEDLMDMDPAGIAEVSVLMTMMAGRVVFSK